MKRSHLLMLVLWVGGIASVGNAQGFRTVALSGTAAPGTSATFDSFDNVVINESGQTAFSARLSGPGVTSDSAQGLWSEGTDSLLLVARAGNSAPGTPDGVVFEHLRAFAFNSAGQTAFEWGLRGIGVTESNYSGLWSEGSGTLALVMRQGDLAPGISTGATFGSPIFSRGQLNSAGQIVLSPGLSDGDFGIWRDDAGKLALVAHKGDPAPGMPEGVTFSSSVTRPIISAAGAAVFVADVIGDGVDQSNKQGIWTDSTGTLALAARTGDVAPGTAGEATFRLILEALDGAGRITFRAFLAGEGFDRFNGIWTAESEAVALVARTGNPAPGTPDGVVFDFINYNWTINDLGRTAFAADLSGPDIAIENRDGIWSEGLGSLSLVARRGDDVPGAPEDWTYRGFGTASMVMNSVGQLAFVAELIDRVSLSSPGYGIWVQDAAGDLQPIAITRGLLEVAPGDSRTIRYLMPQISDGFNDSGELAFVATFTDGTSGVFIYDLAAIPEPSSHLLVMTVALFTLSTAPRRQRPNGV